jgi:RNA polymerase sigma-70 factor (ECF subfamily)
VPAAQRNGGTHLIQRHNRRLYRIARAIVRDDAEAEDVVQEAYLHAFRQFHQYRGEAALATWLSRIAVNEALQRVRRRRPTASLRELDVPPQGTNVVMLPTTVEPPATPEADSARQQVRAMLERAIAALPDGYRAVFLLRDVEQMSVREAAELLALKPETVKTRLHRARAQVRASLQGQLGLGFADLFPFDGDRCNRVTDGTVGLLRSEGLLYSMQ